MSALIIALAFIYADEAKAPTAKQVQFAKGNRRALYHAESTVVELCPVNDV